MAGSGVQYTLKYRKYNKISNVYYTKPQYKNTLKTRKQSEPAHLRQGNVVR